MALRVAFDEIIFCQWAKTWREAAAHGPESYDYLEDLTAFDQALTKDSLPSASVVRSLDDSVRGAWRLLKKQALTFALQVAATVAAVIFIVLR